MPNGRVLAFAHPDDDAATWADQIETVARLAEATRRTHLEFLLEVIPSRSRASTTRPRRPAIMERVRAERLSFL